MIRRKSMFTLVTSLVLAAILCLSMAVPALATDDDPNKAYPAKEAAITKILEVPYGTVVPPYVYFTFDVTKVSEDGGSPSADMPDIGSIRIDFDGSQKLIGTSGDVTGYFRESEDIFKNKQWKHAGVYEYKVVENSSSSYRGQDTATLLEKLTYSRAEYTVYVYVADVDGKGNYEITHIGVLRVRDDDNNRIPDEEQAKLDPTPGGDGEEGSYSEMTFVNSYVKTNKGDEYTDPDDWTLAISKKVSGAMSNPNTYFSFDLTINAPSLLSGVPGYTARVVEYDSDNGTYSIIGSDRNFNSGTSGSFQLKHNQFLVFLDLPVGTSYEVTEKANADYTPEAKYIYNGKVDGNAEGVKGGALALPEDLKEDIKTLFVGEGLNRSDFINEHGQTTPTGISLDNLPFIVLIALGLATLSGYIVFKIRRSKKITN